jgi:hypothetical protein
MINGYGPALSWRREGQRCTVREHRNLPRTRQSACMTRSPPITTI